MPRYPGITRAAVEMAYDNGAINRTRSEAQLIERLGLFLTLSPIPSNDLQAMNGWLETLTKEQLTVAVAGEELEMQALLAGAPEGTTILLETIFNEVL